MKKIILAGFCVLMLPMLSIGQKSIPWQGKTTKVKINSETGKPEFMRFHPSQALSLGDLESFLIESLDMTQDDGFLPDRIHQDALGWTHSEFQLTHHGYLVEGAKYKAHVKNGKVLSLNGLYYEMTHHPVQTIDENTGLSKALAHVQADQYRWESPAEENHLQLTTGDPNASYHPQGKLVYMTNDLGHAQDKFRLAWKYDVYAISPLSRQDIYIDAENGQVIFVHDKIHTINANGIAQTRFTGQQNIVTDSTAMDFRLRETGRAAGVETYNMMNGNTYGAAQDYTDDDNYWDVMDLAHTTGGSDAHWGAEMTFDYYLSVHNRNSFDDNGSKLLSYTNYQNNYSNAFWDGIRMTYGAGGGNSFPFSVLDVCGHEFTHGVTGNSAGLIYQNESGALNESFSDIFGICIDFFANPNANWELGEQIGGIRNMANPGAYNDPDTYHGSNWSFGSFDNGGVHTNSGVQNFWFYLLSVGGNGTNDIGDVYNVSGITQDKAAQIAYRNLNVYLMANHEYEDARFYAIEAAIDIYGECSNEMIQTFNAWYAVGLGTPFTGDLRADFITYDSSHCSSPAVVEFLNQSTSSLSHLWNFGDGFTSTDFSPTHTYTNIGTYDVSLVAYGCNNSQDSTIQLGRIVIDPTQACNVNLPSNDSTNVSGCSGVLYDSGGALDYLPNNLSTVVIQSGSSQNIVLDFQFIDYFAGDYLVIYDGPSNQSPLLGYYGGTTTPAPITSTGSALTIVENTNGFNEHAGFQATWSCAVGVENASSNQWSIYPNPASQKLQVFNSRFVASQVHIQVVDLYGKTLLSRNLGLTDQVNESLDISSFASGLYFVQIKQGENSHTIKFLKD